MIINPELNIEVIEKEIFAVDSEFYISNNEGIFI